MSDNEKVLFLIEDALKSVQDQEAIQEGLFTKFKETRRNKTIDKRHEPRGHLTDQDEKVRTKAKASYDKFNNKLTSQNKKLEEEYKNEIEKINAQIAKLEQKKAAFQEKIKKINTNQKF